LIMKKRPGLPSSSITGGASEAEKEGGRFYAKYPKYETDAELDPEDSVIIELMPEKKFSWGFE